MKLRIFGCIIVIISLLCSEDIKEFLLIQKEQIKIRNGDYDLVLEIPAIKLKRGINDIKSVDEGIMIINNNNNMVLAAHSGDSYISHFKNLYKLKEGDVIYLYKNNTIYIYIIDSIQHVLKNGYIDIKRDYDLVLTTCYQEDKQLVINSFLKCDKIS